MKNFFYFFQKHKFIFLLIIILILAGFAGWYFWQKKNTVIFSSSNIEFNFTYNQRIWQKVERQELYHYYPPKSDPIFSKKNSKDTTFGIIAKDFPGKKSLNIESSVKELDKTLPESMISGSFEKISSGTFDIIDTTGIDYKYKFSVKTGLKGEMFWGIQRQIIFFKNEKLYTIVFTATPEEFEKDIKDFEKILKTFKIK